MIYTHVPRAKRPPPMKHVYISMPQDLVDALVEATKLHERPSIADTARVILRHYLITEPDRHKEIWIKAGSKNLAEGRKVYLRKRAKIRKKRLAEEQAYTVAASWRPPEIDINPF